MGKLQVFEVIFDGDNLDVFSSGDTVSGFVKIVLAAPKDNIKGIKVKFHGKAFTSWSEGSGDDKKTYSACETYFKEEITCLEKAKNDTSAAKLCLDAGEHRYPFSFKIPNKPLPYPFEGFVGWIRYSVKCKISRHGLKFDHRTRRLFTITGCPVDLRTMPRAKLPVHDESSKTVCCLCCATGPIITKASLDKSGFVPGESIFVSGIVENNSSRTILNLSAKLIQTATFLASGHSRRETNTMAKLKAPGCREGEVARMDWKPLEIPPIPPTGPEGCRIIRIKYEVLFEGDIENTPFDAEVTLPVVIGTIPVYQTLYPDPSAVVIDQPSSSASGPPPPSYEMAVNGPQEIPSKDGHDYTFGKLMYAPYYPTYNLPLQPPTWDPMHPPQEGDPIYPPSGGEGYPPPVAYPPASSEQGYPPPAVYPPASGEQGYPSPVGYPPASGEQGYPPSGGHGEPPPTGYPQPADGQGYPPPNREGFPPSASYPPPTGALDNPPADEPGNPPSGEMGHPPPNGAGDPPLSDTEEVQI